jgi:hypothetical protein
MTRTAPNRGAGDQDGDEGGKHASPRHPKRLNGDLSQQDHDALLGARWAARVPMADRVRGLLSLWREDPALAAAVSIRAQELLPPPARSSAVAPHHHSPPPGGPSAS